MDWKNHKMLKYPVRSSWIVLTTVVLIIQCQQKQNQSHQQPPSTADPAPRVAEQYQTPAEKIAGQISLARNFYFIFDGSGSMRDPLRSDCGGDQSFRRKLEGAKWAVAEFLKKIPEDVNLGLYVFDEHHFTRSACQVVPLGPNNLTAFLQAIYEVEAGGGTPLAPAIQFGTEILARQREQQLGYGEFRLIVVTDGLARDLPAAAEFANEKAIPIYAIGLCIQEDHPLRHYAVSYRAANDFQDLARALEATVAETEFYDAQAFEGLGQNDR
jgi:hypothetical protein